MPKKCWWIHNIQSMAGRPGSSNDTGGGCVCRAWAGHMPDLATRHNASSRTQACSRRLTASAVLLLPAAPDAWRSASSRLRQIRWVPWEEAPPEKGVHVVGKAIIVIVLCLTGLVQAQEPRRPPRDVWNEGFTKRQGRAFPHHQFLAERIKGRKPGTALDIGIGEGRNALFLATQGWEVTGFNLLRKGLYSRFSMCLRCSSNH